MQFSCLVTPGHRVSLAYDSLSEKTDVPFSSWCQLQTASLIMEFCVNLPFRSYYALSRMSLGALPEDCALIPNTHFAAQNHA